MGDRYLELAAAAARQGERDRAVHLYRSGLSRSPLNTAGRLGLAQLYLEHGRPDLAKSLLIDRLPELAANPAYLERALQFLLEFQFDTELAAICDRLLRAPLDPGPRQVVALQAATLAFHRGSYERAETLLFAHGLDSTAAAGLLLARIDCERGNPELALLRLTDLLRRDAAPDAAYVLLGQVQRQLGRTDELERLATLRLAQDPLSPAPRIDLLHLQHERGDAGGLEREIASFLTRFGHQPPALLALGDFAAHRGRPELAQRLVQLFRERGWPTDAPTLLAAEASLAAGRHADGLRLLQAARRADPEFGRRHAAVLAGLQAVALFGLNQPDDARLHLEHLLAQPNLRAENLQLVAARLSALGHETPARTLLTRAVALDPLHQSALTDLVRLEARQKRFATLPAHVRRLLAMRKPSREVLALAASAWDGELEPLQPEHAALLGELRAHAAVAASGR